MNIIVIGLGSMGKRRIRLLKENPEYNVLGVDSNIERRQETTEKFQIQCYTSLTEALSEKNIDCAFVCTSPLSHADIIHECLQQGLHVFTEINLIPDRYDENLRLAKEKGLVLFLSSTFLYRKETQTIINKVHQTKSPLNYIYHVGQYLPDWHPWESYNNYFIGDSRTNGCREIMAIDLPWLVTAFGPIKRVSAAKSKNTGLNINYNDNYLITIEHENGNKGVFAVDVVTRKAIRHIDIYGEYFQMSWNGTPDSLVEYDIENKTERRIEMIGASEHEDGYAAFITENPYREEIWSFLNLVQGNDGAAVWDFEKDKNVLKIIDIIEQHD